MREHVQAARAVSVSSPRPPVRVIGQGAAIPQSRAELEAAIWELTGRRLSGVEMDALLDLVDEYAAALPRKRYRPLHHVTPPDPQPGGTVLYPLIGVLAEAMGVKGARNGQRARSGAHSPASR